MKKVVLLIIVFSVIGQFLFAQKTFEHQIKKKKKEVIYLELDSSNKLTSLIESGSPDRSVSTSSKDNSINIYMKWLNPLKYKVSWKDSTSIDDRNKLINDFLNLLIAPFNLPLLEGEAPPPGEEKVGDAVAGGTTEIKAVEFTDVDLQLLVLMLKRGESDLDSAEIVNLNSITSTLKLLEDTISKTNVTKEAIGIYSKLSKFKTIDAYVNDSTGINTRITDIESTFGAIGKLQNDIAIALKPLEIKKDKVLSNYTKVVISNYLERSNAKLKADQEIIVKLKPFLKILRNSISSQSRNLAMKGYVKLRNVAFDNGQKLETTLSITEYEFSEANLDFKKKKDVVNEKMIFRKFDNVDISVNTGWFYANTTLKSFGVSNESGSDFVITEDNINRDKAVSALFLNLNFGNSDYFSPLIQIGIDPTKKRPFLMLGAGFTIPAAKFSISGGPLWTWNQTLNELSIGETISSTTDLEKDIQYKFEVEPKGWYLGIQFKLFDFKKEK